MTPAARSLQIFGMYLIGLALGLAFAPDLLLAPFGFAPADRLWVRVAAMLVLFIGCYYLVAAKAQIEPLIRASVATRSSVIMIFGALVALGWAPPALLLFGAVDLAGAIWTALALRRGSASTRGGRTQPA